MEAISGDGDGIGLTRWSMGGHSHCRGRHSGHCDDRNGFDEVHGSISIGKAGGSGALKTSLGGRLWSTSSQH
uniref:Uncharacterized protein n=1 Tax=Romanomermis culicivorax TaxID=13658 RepID=A0A915J4I3_ROMCU